MPGFRNRYYPSRCPKCTRGLYAAPTNPIRSSSGKDIYVCGSCARYEMRWAQWEAQASGQTAHNREAHKRAARGSGVRQSLLAPEPAQRGGES